MMKVARAASLMYAGCAGSVGWSPVPVRSLHNPGKTISHVRKQSQVNSGTADDDG